MFGAIKLCKRCGYTIGECNFPHCIYYNKPTCRVKCGLCIECKKFALINLQDKMREHQENKNENK